MGDNALVQTQQTYTAVAADYVTFHHDRSSVAPLLRRFRQQLPEPGPLLDAGCGPGFDAAQLRAWGHPTTALDLSLAMMQAGRPYFPTVPFSQGDLRCLPFGDGVFAGIWLLASLLHLPRVDTAVALAEAYRVLRPGGAVILSVKEGDGEMWTSAVAGRPGRRFFTYWQPAALDALLSGAGFAVVWGQTRDHWLSRLVVKPG